MTLYSASQIALFRECARKWAWRYIAGLKTEPHPSAVLGTEVDNEQLQPYLRDGRPFDFTRESGYIAASGIEWLPQPKLPGLEVQKHFVMPSPASGGKFQFQGYMDLWLPDSAPVPGLAGGVPFVGDFKTTSNLKWAKNAVVLSTDVQAMLYATYALYATRAEQVDLTWIYFQTKGPRRSMRTHLRVHTDHVVTQFRAIEETALQMHAAREAGVEPLELPPTPSQCEAYGGCPYRSRCNLSPADHIASLSAKVDMSSLLDNLRAKKAGASGAPSAGAPGTETAKPPIGSASPPVETEAAPPAPPPSPLGVNPPEKDLPPAEPRKKRGPKAAPKDPVGADVAAAIAQASVKAVRKEPSPPTEAEVEACVKAAETTPDLATAIAQQIDLDALACRIADRFMAKLAK